MPPSLIELLQAGLVNEVEQILHDEVRSKEIFLNHVGSYTYQFIGLASRNGSIDILRHCMSHGIEVQIGNTYGLHALVGAASQGHDHIVKWLLEPWIRGGRIVNGKSHLDELSLPQDWLHPSLHKAIQNKHVSTVKLLVQDAWAGVNACDDDNLRPIHTAADNVDKDNSEQMTRYEEIVEILVNAEASVNDVNPRTGMTPLHDAVIRNSCEATSRLIDAGANVLTRMNKNRTTVLHTAAAAGFHETLSTILEHHRFREIDPEAFDKKNVHGKTPLYLATEGGHVECIRILIKKGSNLASKPNDRMTVVETLLKCVPHPVDFLTEILDDQVTETDETGNRVILDYQILKSNKNPKQQYLVPDTEITSALICAVRVHPKRAAILQHPLVETFLQLQYRNIMFYEMFYLLVQFLRVCLVSWQVTHVTQVRQHLGTHVSILSTLMLLTLADGGMRVRRGFLSGNVPKKDMILLLFSTLSSFVGSFVEIATLARMRHGTYDPPSRVQLRSFTILISWMNLMMLTTRFPMTGEYFYMFVAVLVNVVRVLLVFSGPIIGFAFSFSILFSSNDQFNSTWKALAKTLVMMTGEYDYDSIFTAAESNGSSLQPSSTIIFLIFVIVTGITLMNLITSLAISDIDKWLKEGRSFRLVRQTECLMVSYYPRSRVIPRKFKLNSNRISVEMKTGLNELALRKLNRVERSQKKLKVTDPSDKKISLADIQESLENINQRMNSMNDRMQQLAQDLNMNKQRSQAELELNNPRNEKICLADIQASLEQITQFLNIKKI